MNFVVLNVIRFSAAVNPLTHDALIAGYEL